MTEQNNHNVTYAPSPQKPKRTFTTAESVLSWVCLFIGYLFWRVVPITSNPLGAVLFIFGLFVTFTVLFKMRGIKFKPMPVIAGVSALVICASLLLCTNAFLNFFAYIYSLCAFCYYVYSLTDNNIAKGFSDLLVFDFIRALFILPYKSFETFYSALFSSKTVGKFSLKMLLGVIITTIPTVIIMLLLSYDKGFSDIISNIFEQYFTNIFSHLSSLLFGVPVGMYFFGLFISSVDNKCKDTITEKTYSEKLKELKMVPVVTVLTAVLPILAIYVIFFISQWKYYISGFKGELLDKYTYAGYAREGFFQLCVIAFINLAIIVAVVLLMRRKSDKPTFISKAVVIIFSLFTLVLISTAVAKMVMYIDFYGLTPKRVYASWMMGLLAIIFVFVIVYQFVPKLNIVALSVSLCVVLFAGLSLANTDGLIARYNVDRYLDKSLETVDLDAMDDLGYAAIPEMVRLVDELEVIIDEDPTQYELYDKLFNKLKREAKSIEREQKNIFSISLPSIRAKNALKGW